MVTWGKDIEELNPLTFLDRTSMARIQAKAICILIKLQNCYKPAKIKYNRRLSIMNDFKSIACKKITTFASAISPSPKLLNISMSPKWSQINPTLTWIVYLRIVKAHNFRVRKCPKRAAAWKTTFPPLLPRRWSQNELQISKGCKYKDNKNLPLSYRFRVGASGRASHWKKDEIFYDIHFSLHCFSIQLITNTFFFLFRMHSCIDIRIF